MVEPRRILVTGAGGFLGRAVVDAAVDRGHHVRAVARRDLPVWNCDRVENVAADLGTANIAPLLRGIDVVVHAAGRMDGDDADQRRETIDPTRRLLTACTAIDRPPLVVLVSSLSVYGHATLAPWAELDETCPTESRPDRRDAYTRARLAQERALHDSALPSWTLRVGAIYGPGRLWNGHLGVARGPVLIRTAKDGEIPLIHVESCARAIALAAETAPPAPGRRSGDTAGPGHEAGPVLNLVDDDLPDRRAYVAQLVRAGWPRVVIPVPWRWLDRIGRIVPGPGLLRPETLRARMMPLRYCNARARARLGWTPEDRHATRIAEALKRGPCA